MAASHYRKKTLAPENQFRFVCPIFQAETKIATCFKVRDRVWRGEQFVERGGCQVCLSASKCPIVHVLNKMMRGEDDPYHSAEPKVGSLEPEILERISPILVLPFQMAGRELNDRERQLIEAANENARAGAKLRSARKGSEEPMPAPKKRAKTIAAPSTDATVKTESKVADAAVTGDFAAAINAAAKAA